MVAVVTTHVLVPTTSIIASFHIPRPLLQVEFNQQDELQLFRMSFLLREGECLQEEYFFRKEMSNRQRLILVSPYVLATRE